jgi:hypothetical protein
MLRKYIVIFVFAATSIYAVLKLYKNLSRLMSNLDCFYGVILGVGLFLLLFFLRFRFQIIQNWLKYFGTRVHESAHEKMALLSGRKLFGYNISDDGSGHIIYESDGNPAPLITLAPYFFSYTSLFLLAFRWITLERWLLYYDIGIGFLLAFHTYIFLIQTRPFQTDIKKMGLVYSYSFLVFAHLNLYSIYVLVIGDSLK